LSNALPRLKTGYATAQTDGGHRIPANFADAWRPDKWGTAETFTDFQYRAIHLMTTVAKAVVAKYYGKPHTKAYFHGCSTGGRQGLMEVQRYPDDYDGVVSMAPVYSLSVQTTAAVRANVLGKLGAALTPDLLSAVNAAVLKACDAKDGLADGLLDDPRQCTWDPSEMLCKAEQSGAACLTQPQVDSLRTLYSGVKTADGRFVAWPLARGDEEQWRAFVALSGPSSDRTNAGGLGALAGPVFGDPNFDLASFDPARHYDVVANSAFAKAYEAKDPNIAAFTNRGGKLLLWHGWGDSGPSPWQTLDYYEKVNKATPTAASNVRLFMAPDVGHCAGGRGLDQVDLLDALDAWVQTGTAPDALPAKKVKPPMTRLLCAYPKIARYKGSGDVNDAASFECK
jgi:feruloyl esterase